MKKKGMKKKLIIALAVIVIIGAAAYAAINRSISVSAFEVRADAVEKFIAETGSVEAASSVVLSSQVQGQILSISVKEGDAVTEGQRIATYTADSGAADIASIRAQISGLSAQASQANDLAEKTRQLYEAGAVSYEEYSQAETAAKQLESQISSLNYTIAGLSEAGGSKGLLAPISGTVTSVLVSEGQLVTPGAPMIEISDISEILVRVNLVSEDADEVVAGAVVRVFSESDRLIDDSANVNKVYIKAQDVMSDLGIYQKRVPVEISLSKAGNLRLGSSVNVEIITDKRENALIVPDNSIFEINKQQYVYKIEGGKAVLQGVETGLEGETYTEITSGLSAGDLVIVSPAREIEDGTKVKVIE